MTPSGCSTFLPCAGGGLQVWMALPSTPRGPGTVYQLEQASGPQGSEREGFQTESASAEPGKQVEGLRGGRQSKGSHLVAM